MATKKKAKKTVGKKLKARIKKTAAKAKNVIKKAANVTVFAPLLPFKVVLKKILSKKGVNVKNMSLPELAKQFHNKIVAPKNNLETIPEHINFESDNLVADAVSLVTTIVKYVKSIRDDKKAGKKLDKDSETLAKATELIEKRLAEKAIQQTEKQTNEIVGEGVKAPKSNNLLMFAIIGLVIFFIAKKS